MTRALELDDATFVRAPVDLVYRRLTDVEAWPTWWSGLTLRPAPAIDDHQRWSVSLAVGPARILRFGLTVVRWRHEGGMRMQLDGDLNGRAEFWLDPLPGGTVVHHVASVESGLWAARWAVRGYQRAARRGLWGFKDVLQVESRTSLGMTP